MNVTQTPEAIRAARRFIRLASEYLRNVAGDRKSTIATPVLSYPACNDNSDDASAILVASPSPECECTEHGSCYAVLSPNVQTKSVWCPRKGQWQESFCGED